LPHRIEFSLAVLVFLCQYLTRELCHVADMESQRRLRSASSLELDIPPTRRVTFNAGYAADVKNFGVWDLILPLHMGNSPQTCERFRRGSGIWVRVIIVGYGYVSR